MIKKIWHNTFFQGSIVFTTVSFGVNIFSYLFNLVVARGIRLESYGEYMAAMSYVTLLSVPLGAFNVIVMRKIGQAHLAHRTAYADAVEHWLYEKMKRFALPLLSIAMVIGSLLLWKSNLHPLSVLYILALSFTSIFTLFYAAVLQAHKEFIAAGRFLLVGTVLKFIGGVITIVLFAHLQLLYLAIFLSQFIDVLYGRHLLSQYHQHKPAVTVKFQGIKTYLRRKTIIAPVLATLGLVALYNVDVMLAKKFFSGEAAGLYAGLSLLGRVILYIAQPLSIVAYSFLTGSDSKHNSPKILLYSTLGLLAICLGSISFYFLFPRFVINLIFGRRFLALSSIIWLTAVFGSLNSLATLIGQYWIAHSSYIGSFSLVAVAIQALGIFFFHDSFASVLWVNCVVTFGLVLAYSLPLLFALRHPTPHLAADTAVPEVEPA